MTNESRDDLPSTNMLDDVTSEALACPCPHHVHRLAHGKRMSDVDDGTADGSLDAFSADDDASGESDASR